MTTLDPGLVVVIVAVLIFYLRLIGLQRERVRRLAHRSAPSSKRSRRGSPPPAKATAVKDSSAGGDAHLRYSLLTRKRSSLLIAAAGVALIVLGLLLNLAWLPLAASQPYWWIPTALGIVMFSWAFQV